MLNYYTCEIRDVLPINKWFKCVFDIWISYSFICIILQLKICNLTVYLSSFYFPVPCTPTNVMASLECHSNSAAVTWERASGALSYVAVGITEDGSHRTECNSSLTQCDLEDLQCGQNYSISVYALDESCSSVESNRAYLRRGNVTIYSQI